MKFMHVMKECFYPLPFGYSGHEIDLLPTLVAVSQGAHIVERHLTLDKKMKGSDHAASLEPGQLKELINNIQRIQKILGVAEKIMYDELVPLREKLAKSVASKISIAKGTKITREMLTVKGPGHGIKPSHLYKLIGAIAREDIPADYIIPKKALDWDRN
jgi:sialic acid synthase SpsE